MYHPKTLFRVAASYAKATRTPIYYPMMAESVFWIAAISAGLVYLGHILTTPIYYLVKAFNYSFGWLPFINLESPEFVARSYHLWQQSASGQEVFMFVMVAWLVAAPLILMLEVMVVNPPMKGEKR